MLHVSPSTSRVRATEQAEGSNWGYAGITAKYSTVSCRAKPCLLQWVSVGNPLFTTVERVDFAAYARAIVEGRMPPPPVAQLIGFRPLSLEAGRPVFELETDLERHANPMAHAWSLRVELEQNVALSLSAFLCMSLHRFSGRARGSNSA